MTIIGYQQTPLLQILRTGLVCAVTHNNNYRKIICNVNTIMIIVTYMYILIMPFFVIMKLVYISFACVYSDLIFT